MKCVSQETIDSMGEAEKTVIFSKFPIDKYDCECQSEIRDIMKNLNKLNEETKNKWYEDNSPYQCPEAKSKKLFNLSCQNCGEVVAQVNANNISLHKWCNFHYISWHDRQYWHGTYGVNIDPYGGDIRIECCCSENKTFTNYKIEEVD